MTTTTVDDLINEMRRHVYALHPRKDNFLTATIAADATTLTLDLPMNGVVAGALLSIDEELRAVRQMADRAGAARP